jgi:hypothetical protein
MTSNSCKASGNNIVLVAMAASRRKIFLENRYVILYREDSARVWEAMVDACSLGE